MGPEHFAGSELNQWAEPVEYTAKNIESERPASIEIPFLENSDSKMGELSEWKAGDSERETIELPKIEKTADGQNANPKEAWENTRVFDADTESNSKGGNEHFEQLDKGDITYEEKIKMQDKEIHDVENGEKDFDRSNTHETGNYGEMKTDQDLRSKGYERISKEMVTDIDENGHKGIDGIYCNPDGKPQYIIVDSKYGSAQLNPETKDGKQMSENWIDKRLDKDVGKEKADDIRMEKMLNPDNVESYVAHVDKDGNVTYDKLDDNANVVERNVKINE